jgi:zinc transport system substrate-binding protein
LRSRIILATTGLVVVALAAIALASGDDDAADPGRPRTVVASFYPLDYAAEQVGRGGVRVTNLTPPGAEPHDLEVSPGDVRQLGSADLVLLLGHDFQPQLERAARSGGRVLELLDTPGLDRFGNDDPHVWLDPTRYARVVRRIARALGDEPAADRLMARLRTLDGDYREGLARCERREIVTSHEAFGYLAQRYRLRQIAITGLSPEAEPAPAALQRVVDLVRETDATTIYFETLVSPELAETVARETGVRTAVLNPIEGLTARERRRGDDYFTLMRANLERLRKGLGCR